ncbi:hypothetical protein DL546_006745 [Coniochaeta pulveracea]|uniref:Uncharacterized protein n=1 Tax=Coniochaeta pulveracea TaxID=177199 RepID=A0A420YC13_9PEZI|nr:hypothetical protein DL546_006745 [Coniochaeta pulveracea]
MDLVILHAAALALMDAHERGALRRNLMYCTLPPPPQTIPQHQKQPMFSCFSWSRVGFCRRLLLSEVALKLKFSDQVTNHLGYLTASHLGSFSFPALWVTTVAA